MTLPEVYFRLYLRLLKAAENDDIIDLYTVHEQNPYLLHSGASIWGENALHVACKHGSLQFVKEVIKVSPGLARKRNNDGFSPLHVASANGHVEIVKVLTKIDSGLCLVEDVDSKIPLHIAAINGKEDVVRVLVLACPESLQRVTTNSETALHLALKKNQLKAFEVLMEEIKKFNQEELVNRRDFQGNTVMHIATSENFIEIVELLLSSNSTNGLVMEVNSLNKRGQTPLDVHYGTLNDTLAREIRQILVNGGAVESRYFSNHRVQISSLQSARQEITGLTMNKRNLLIMVFVMTATFMFVASCSPPNKYQPPECGDSKCPVQYKELPRKWGHKPFPTIFYYMMISMVGFVTSMGAILVLIWPLPLRMVGTFVIITVLIVYVLSVDMAMAPFSVMLGSYHISSTAFVWFFTIAFTFCGVTIWFLVKLCHRVYHGRGEAMKSRTIQVV